MLSTTIPMSAHAMNLYDPERNTVNKIEPLAVNFAGYEQNFDQWKLWEQNERRRRRLTVPISRKNRRSLLIEKVDPRIEHHMRWNAINSRSKLDGKMELKRATLPTMKDPRLQWLSRGNSKQRTFPIHHEQRYKNDESVCSTFVSESDDSSDTRCPPPESFHIRDEPNLVDLHLSRTLALEQEAMTRAMELEYRQKEEEWQQDTELSTSRDNVTILPPDRVKRALNRGESIRMLKCSGCGLDLFITPDLPLVYCADCQCFSHLKYS